MQCIVYMVEIYLCIIFKNVKYFLLRCVEYEIQSEFQFSINFIIKYSVKIYKYIYIYEVKQVMNLRSRNEDKGKVGLGKGIGRN